MRRINISPKARDKLVHIEFPGGLINIHLGLTNSDGQDVTHISISADGDRYAGNPEYWVNGEHGNAGLGLRIVKDSRK